MLRYLLAFLILTPFIAQSQFTPPPCNNDPPPEPTVNQVVPLCEGLDPLNEYCLTLMANACAPSNGNFPGCNPNQWILNNPNWFGFIAGAPQIGIRLDITNCNMMEGVQFALYEATGLIDPGPNCMPQNEPLLTITQAGLPQCPCITGPAVFDPIMVTEGATYYLVFDGCNGDVCDIFITVDAGGQAPSVADPTDIIYPPAGFLNPVGGDLDTICVGATGYPVTSPVLSGASSYIWTLPDGSLEVTFDPEFLYDVPAGAMPGDILTFCVVGRSDCDTSDVEYCEDFVLAELPPVAQPPIFLCEGSTGSWIGGAVGPYTGLSADLTTTITVTASNPTFYGCDYVASAVVTVQNENDEAPTPIDTIKCGQPPFTIFGATYNMPVTDLLIPQMGAAPNGCDLFYSLSLDFLYANLTYNPNSATCIAGAVQVCAASANYLPAPGSPGLNIAYSWTRTSDGAAVGNGTECLNISLADFTQDIETFELTITMTINGQPAPPCMYGPFTVTLDRNDLLPSLGIISGPMEVCVNQIANYTFATTDTDGPNPTWSNTLGASVLLQDFALYTLQFGTVGIGQVCIMPTNACGSAMQTCLDVTVVDQPNAGPDGFACDLDYDLNGSASGSSTWRGVSIPTATATITFADASVRNTTVTVNETGTYQFEWGNANCSDRVTVTFLDSIVLDGAEAYFCDNANVNYTIEFSVTGGLPPYTVASGNGMMTGNMFESDPIPSNDGFTVIIEDAAGCQSEFTFNPHECSCATEGGTMQSILLSSCGAICFQGISNLDTIMDANDVAEYILHDQPGASISNVIRRNRTGLFCFITGTTDFDVTYYISIVVGDSLADGSVNLSEGCTRVAPGQPVIWYEVPVAQATAGAPTCADSVLLTATPSAGIGSWFVVSGPGTSVITDVNALSTSVNVSACGQYTFGWTEDNNGCRDTMTVMTTFFCNPTVANIQTPCNGTQTEIDLTITLQNGTEPYTETSGRGTITGSVYTLNTLPLNTPDTFYFIDDNGCELTVPVPIGDCACVSESGDMVIAARNACQDQPIIFGHALAMLVLDANDSLRYFVHTRADDTLGTIIAISDDTEVLFSDGAFICDSTYYVSAVVGNWTGTEIDLADPCINVARGQSIRYDCQVMVDAGMDITSCDINLDLVGNSSSGAGVWTSLSPTAMITGVDNLTGNATLPGPGVYTFQFASNNGDCTNDDQVIVTVPESPIIDLASIDIQCNGDNDMYTVSFTITGGDAATYMIVGSTTGMQAGNTFTSDLIASGDAYSFQVFDVNDCTRDLIDGDFTCPCVTTAGILTPEDLNLCEEENVDASTRYDVSGEIPDGTDVRNYILSDNQTNPESNILSANTTGQFSFDGAFMTFGTTYYIGVILGNGTSPNTVDPNDPCLSVSDVLSVTWYNRIDAFTIDPTGTEITCQVSQVSLSVMTTDDVTGYDILWTTTDGNIEPGDETMQTARVNSAGTYTVTISHPLAGCDESQMITITQSADVPTVVISDPIELDCATNEISISGAGSSASPTISYEWNGPGIVGSNTGIDIIVNAIGVYTLTVSNAANGCDITGNVTVTENRDLPIVVATANERLDCDSDQVTVSGVGSLQGTNVTYAWTTVDGNIISGADEINVIVDGPGTYQLTVVNLDNGCSDVAQATVIEEANIISNFDVEVQESGCAGVDDGVISVVNIIGGVPPYSYSFDGGLTFGVNNSQSGFGPGTYPVNVRDNNGCEVNGSAFLAAPFDFFVDLGEDLIVELGSEVTLSALTNLPDSLRRNIQWSPIFDTLNQNTLTQIFTPVAGQYSFVLAITNANGCVEQDQVSVFVRFEERVFIPNAMHPNGLAMDNRYLNIYANPASVASISSFQVFDRWGNRVFQRGDVPVQLTLNTLYAWDGTVDGEEAQPGVYTYFVELEYVTGVKRLISGGVTLVK